MQRFLALSVSVFFFASFCGISRSEEPGSPDKPSELVADLDPLIHLPGAYALTPDDLETLYDKGDWNKNPYFKWLRSDKSRAIFQKKDMGNLKVDLTMLDGSVP